MIVLLSLLIGCWVLASGDDTLENCLSSDCVRSSSPEMLVITASSFDN